MYIIPSSWVIGRTKCDHWPIDKLKTHTLYSFYFVNKLLKRIQKEKINRRDE